MPSKQATVCKMRGPSLQLVGSGRSPGAWLQRKARDLFCGMDGKLPTCVIILQHVHLMYSQTHLLLDQEPRVGAVLLGQPRGRWPEVHKEAFKALFKAAKYFNEMPVKPHMHGNFHSIAHRISFGGGQQTAGFLRQWGEAADNELNCLMQNKAIQRICNHASGKPL